MIPDMKRFLEMSGSVVLSKVSYEWLRKRAEALYAIRAEIEQISTTKCTETCEINISAKDFKEKVLEIIDKYEKGTR